MKDNTAISVDNKFIIGANRKRCLRKSTKGWKLEILWRDRSISWILLKCLKKLNPIEVAEFSKARNISNKLAFLLQVLFVLRNRDVIIL